MRLLIASLCAVLIFPLAAQESIEWESDYHHYQGSYKCDFPCKWVLSAEQRDSLDRTYCAFFNLHLTDLGTYSMTLEYYKNVEGKIANTCDVFMGTYVVDVSGKVILNGTHPFDSNELQIHEDISRYKKKKYVDARGFKYRFNESYYWITKKRLGTYCDGCSYNPED